MKRFIIITTIGLLAIGFLGTAMLPNAVADCGVCEGGKDKDKSEHKHKHGKCSHPPRWHHIQEAVCVIHPTAGNTANGVVRFFQNGHEIKVVADIEGLSPNSTHAIHVHQFGDCSSPDGKSAGGHYNPQKHDHALPPTAKRHAGDLGNLTADADGKAHYEITVGNLCIAGPKNPLLGRAIILHAKPDDGGQPTGNAGPRIGYGVIGIANSPANQPPATGPGK